MANNNNQIQDILTLLLSNRLGGGNDLGAVIEALGKMGDPKKKATERDTDIDMTNEFFDQWRETEHRPMASGVPYIFTGGSVFPQTQGQQRAEKMAGAMGFGSNMLDVGNNTLEALLDAWKRRKGGQS